MFPSTAWSAIRGACDTDAPAALRGLERLARAYWRPLYHFLRKRGSTHEEAADQVQGFFEHILSHDFLREVRPGAGRFRNFLLVSLRRWVRDERNRATAQKRGGGAAHLPIDELLEMEVDVPGDAQSPEHAFDQRWAREVFRRAMVNTREAWAKRVEVFAALQASLDGSVGNENYAQIGARLNMTEGAVKKAAFDLRKTFAANIRAEIELTVADPAEVEDELRHLIQLLRQPG